MIVQTSELTGRALDLAVSMTKGWRLDPYRPANEGQIVKGESNSMMAERALIGPMPKNWSNKETPFYSPSTDWAQGGPLIDEYKITLEQSSGGEPYACLPSEPLEGEFGPTALVAAMRALVQARLGSSVEIPDELLQQSG